MVLGLEELSLSAEQCLVIMKHGVNVGWVQLSGRVLLQRAQDSGYQPQHGAYKKRRTG